MPAEGVELLESHLVELEDGRKVRVLSYSDQAIRVRLDGAPYLIEESFLGNRNGQAILKFVPKHRSETNGLPRKYATANFIVEDEGSDTVSLSHDGHKVLVTADGPSGHGYLHKSLTRILDKDGSPTVIKANVWRSKKHEGRIDLGVRGHFRARFEPDPSSVAHHGAVWTMLDKLLTAQGL